MKKKQHKNLFNFNEMENYVYFIYYLPFSWSLSRPLVLLSWVYLSISYFYDGKFLIVFERLDIPCCLCLRRKIGYEVFYGAFCWILAEIFILFVEFDWFLVEFDWFLVEFVRLLVEFCQTFGRILQIFDQMCQFFSKSSN